MNIPTICRYCGGDVILCDSSNIYRGKSCGNSYIRTHCRTLDIDLCDQLIEICRENMIEGAA